MKHRFTGTFYSFTFASMDIYTEFSDYQPQRPLALSLGMFDGVHLGHKSIIDALLRTAADKDMHAAILTFWPHPRLVFNPDDRLKLLTNLEEKTALLLHYGIGKLFVKDFDEDFRNLSGEDFVKKILVDQLQTQYLIVGHDHVFGKNRSGNFELLQKLAPELGFEVVQMEAVNLHNTNISSTKIRNALEMGNIPAANEMLGYAYSLSGKVIHGKKIGRQIGYPTANIETDPVKLLPKKGAYIVDVFVKNHRHNGMLSIGNNPTVNGQNLSVEVHILDFDEDIYEETITVKFREFLHEEIKFENLEKLIEQLHCDQKRTREYFL